MKELIKKMDLFVKADINHIGEFHTILTCKKLV